MKSRDINPMDLSIKEIGETINAVDKECRERNFVRLVPNIANWYSGYSEGLKESLKILKKHKKHENNP